MNYEPLDSLPYIDEDISDSQRGAIQDLIRKELENEDILKIHPTVDQLYPSIETHSILDDIDPQDLIKDDFTIGGIDLSRYSDLENTENLKKSIIYQHLKYNTLKLLNEYGSNQWLITNDLSLLDNEKLEKEVGNKRQKINDLNQYRQQVQLEIKPTIDYLSKRWEDGIAKNIDIGVEIANLL